MVAAVACIAEVGVGNVTHRRIAASAGVPLGSTTYYFPTLHDLVAAALTEVATRAQDDLARWSEALRPAEDRAGALVRLLADYLSDRSRALLEYELYLAAARDDQLAPAARIWLDGLTGLFAEFTDPVSARALCALVDGLLVAALVTGEELDGTALESAARLLLRGAGTT